MAEFPKNLAQALFAIQGELSGVKKDSTNPHFKNKYASLEAVIETVRPAMRKHGVVFMQSPGQFVDGALAVTTTLVHAESGECIHSTMSSPLQKADPQGVGACVTYLCRYSLMALLGIPPVDDDAHAATISKEELEWGNRDVRNLVKVVEWIIKRYVTQATDAFEFAKENQGMLAPLPVKARKYIQDRLDRVGGRADETQPQQDAAE